MGCVTCVGCRSLTSPMTSAGAVTRSWRRCSETSWGRMRTKGATVTGSRGRRVTFKLHIDHIDNPDGDVWVVEWPGHYVTAHQVWCEVPLHATPVRQRQPRASLSGRGVVRVGRVLDGNRIIDIQEH